MTEKDLIWALWFFSDAQLMHRTSRGGPAPKADYDRYDAIIAWATAKYEETL
jgi:hypothetical protein